MWVSFLIGGIIALIQGYSFAKLGARYPSAGGLIDWIIRAYGRGLFTAGIVMLGYFSVIIVAAMVALSFGSYATDLFLALHVRLVVGQHQEGIVVQEIIDDRPEEIRIPAGQRT